MLSIEKAQQAAVAELMQECRNGFWTGQLSASALSTATAITVLALKLVESDKAEQSDDWMSEQMLAGVHWLQSQQNPDGGWGDTNQSYSNISTTLLTIAALELAAKTASCDGFGFEASIRSGWDYVKAQGGLDALQARYGKDKTFAVPILANCAIAGLVPWDKVSPLPFELACVPQSFYRFVRMPVVSYAIPALVAIGQARYFAQPPRNPVTRAIRAASIQRSLKVLTRMQPASGGFLEAIPLTCFVAMALIHSGRGNHEVVNQALKFVRSSFRSEGSWPIDTNLATWVTTLSINAVAPEYGLKRSNSTRAQTTAQSRDFRVKQIESLHQSVDLDWLLSCQHKTRHPFTGAQPGGWGWSDLSGAVPDADDTPGALLALDRWLGSPNLDAKQIGEIFAAAQMGVSWLIELQNRDQGWPTFCRGWGRLPFDRSGSDITAHVLRAIHRWNLRLKENSCDNGLTPKIEKAIASGLNYLRKTQTSEGSWNPLWFGNQDHPEEENPIYGTAKVLTALVELGVEDEKFVDAKTDTNAIRQGLVWLIGQQNRLSQYSELESESLEGWGGPSGYHVKPESINQKIRGLEKRNFGSSIEETSLALEALILARSHLSGYWPEMEENWDRAIFAGLAWLAKAVNEGKHRQTSPIGFYFAKLWYYEKLYPMIFCAAALTRAIDSEWNRIDLAELYPPIPNGSFDQDSEPAVSNRSKSEVEILDQQISANAVK